MTIKLKVSKEAEIKLSDCAVIVASNAKDLNSLDIYTNNKKHIDAKFKKKKNSLVPFYIDGQYRLLAIAAAKKENDSEYYEDLRKLGAGICSNLNKDSAAECDLVFVGEVSTDMVIAVIEGVELSNYQFLKYKSKKDQNALSKITVHATEVTQAQLNELSNVLTSVELARDLVNEPVITLNAETLSKEIVKAGKKSGYTTKVLKKADIEKLGMGGLLGVNAGSIDPPTFNILEWKPKKFKNKKPIVLVGKGVVYDTGGNNLKPGSYMSTMKADMGGSAAVVGTMNAVASNNLPLHVIGLIPATDNRIGKNAIVADDVLKMYDGSTVEVQNTDAEGRLILADALAYAKQYKPGLVIDLATLTGAAAAIVGTFGIAMMGTAGADQKTALTESGDRVYERLAEMPYWREYNDLLKSDIAYIKNIGGPTGGAITAGKFLEHFTDYPWIHLDIAGPAFLTKSEPYKPVGGTGVGIRLLYDFLRRKSGKK